MNVNSGKLQEMMKTGRPGVLLSMGHKELDTTGQLNYNNFIFIKISRVQRHFNLKFKKNVIEFFRFVYHSLLQNLVYTQSWKL